MAFSYSGLVEQLEFEQYSHDDAVYAADNCGADWNKQAAKSAKNYLVVFFVLFLIFVIYFFCKFIPWFFYFWQIANVHIIL